MAIKVKKIKFGRREKRKLRTRKRTRGAMERPRLCVYRSRQFTYAQIISDDRGVTLISASSREPQVMEKLAALGEKDTAEGKKASTSSKSMQAARMVGLVLAERGREKGISSVVFDRNGFLYHGRIQALADGAREGGLQF